MPKEIQLKPIKESSEDYERLEKKLIEFFRAEIYLPLLKTLGQPSRRLDNSSSPLVEAIRSGRLTFSRGSFSGRMNSAISKELRELGARWDRITRTWKVPASSLPPELLAAIDASQAKFTSKLKAIDQKLAQILPEEIAGKFEAVKIFDASLWKVDQEFRKNVENIMVAPQLTPERRKRLAEEWQDNMRLWIKDFSEKEISKLRGDLQETLFAGNRYESTVKTIQKSYDVSLNKAKFLARQETSLLMTKFKETRYADAGVMEYRWGCVAGSKAHPVRPSHKALEGKVFRWDDPPITTMPGETVRRNNPGQDYNCRCFAKPIVRF